MKLCDNHTLVCVSSVWRLFELIFVPHRSEHLESPASFASILWVYMHGLFVRLCRYPTLSIILGNGAAIRGGLKTACRYRAYR